MSSGCSIRSWPKTLYPPDPEVDYYQIQGAEPVGVTSIAARAGLSRDAGLHASPQQRNQGRNFKGTLRHDSRSLALAVMRFYRAKAKRQSD